MALLEVKNLTTWLFLRRGIVKAMNDISFTIDRGETLGIVGESGSGKTITALSIMRLLPASGKIVSGSILFEGTDLVPLPEKVMRKYRGKNISLILQDPLTSLNPVFTIGDQVGEGIRINEGTKGPELKKKEIELLKLMGIPDATTRINEYPHQFSGGMRQRVVGAVCLACHPQLIIADEPTTALDVTVQLQYLNLLRDIQKRENIALIFITHDFGIVAKMCSKVAVMYAGRIVESAEVRDLFNHPAHPYSEALLSSIPKVEEKVDKLYSINGSVPSLLELPTGCAFLPRCAKSIDRCKSEDYPPEIILSVNHIVRCWHYA
jgi:oligopeptide/dipeptide ABC transporter ATP-binding protein